MIHDPDPFDLHRFVAAQDLVMGRVHAELAAGRKQSHWMWFVFPQLRGLGSSYRAQFYGIGGLAEAAAYLAHPVLGPRLIDCTQAVLIHADRTPAEIFGSPDDVKFVSSMSLFTLAQGQADGVFAQALARWNGGAMDGRTMAGVGLEDGAGL